MNILLFVTLMSFRSVQLLTSNVEDEEMIHANTKVLESMQMLPAIPALIPSLASEHIAITQAIDLPQANIYYMNVKTDIAKGSVAANTSLIAATTGHSSTRALRQYATDRVVGETVNSAGSGARTQTLSALDILPPISGSIVVYATTIRGGVTAAETFTDNGDLTLTGSRGSTATVTIATGVVILDSGSGNTISAGAAVTADYRVSPEVNTSVIGGLRFEVTSKAVTAEVFPLRVDYTAFAQILMQRAHGIVLNKAAMDFAIQEIRLSDSKADFTSDSNEINSVNCRDHRVYSITNCAFAA